MMRYRSAQATIYKMLREKLVRKGVPIGETAGYPRVEIHSFTENAPLDKDGLLRSLSCIVESMSTKSYGTAVTMNGENLARVITDEPVTFDGFTVLAVIPDQLTELTETLETQDILYRQLQRINITIWQN